jgi:DNA repair protein RadD
MLNKFPLFGRRDLLVIDEAHLVSPNDDTSYLKFIQELQWGELDPAKINSQMAFNAALNQARNFNPYLRVIGLTATPYRLGLGCMTNGNIFTDIAYNLCTIEGFNRLIAEGYLAPLIPKRTAIELDVSNVGMTKGEFAPGELQQAVDKSEVTYAALTETVNYGHDRRSWLIFASGIEHAEHIGEMLNSAFGVPTCVIHSKKTDKENAEALEAWKAGKYRAAVNMNSLTTGVDHPAIDLIAMLRPTMSTGLWVQMLGRGTRPFPGKANCLVLDFAGNTRRLGPINDPVIPKLKGKGPPGDAPVRICDQCGTYNHASAKVCFVCGFEFPVKENLSRYASNEELLRSDLPQIESFPVQRVILTPHVGKSSGAASIKVSYFCGGSGVPRTFYEYISVEGSSQFWRKKSRDWFRQRYTNYASGEHSFNEEWDDDVPKTNAIVVHCSEMGLLRKPEKIRVWLNKQSPEIMGYEF